MSLVKKSDVKNHLSPRHRTQIHLCQPASQPDATGFSAAETGEVQAGSSEFATDLVAEHASSGTVLAQCSPLAGSAGPQPPKNLKSVQP